MFPQQLKVGDDPTKLGAKQGIGRSQTIAHSLLGMLDILGNAQKPKTSAHAEAHFAFSKNIISTQLTSLCFLLAF